LFVLLLAWAKTIAVGWRRWRFTRHHHCCCCCGGCIVVYCRHCFIFAFKIGFKR